VRQQKPGQIRVTSQTSAQDVKKMLKKIIKIKQDKMQMMNCQEQLRGTPGLYNGVNDIVNHLENVRDRH
jgi:hypothetical protein